MPFQNLPCSWTVFPDKKICYTKGGKKNKKLRYTVICRASFLSGKVLLFIIYSMDRTQHLDHNFSYLFNTSIFPRCFSSCNQCFGSGFIESGSESSMNSDPDPDPGF